MKTLDKEKKLYLKEKGKKVLERYPVFELKGNGVHVSMMNEGYYLVGFEKSIISYDSFNQYLSKGLLGTGKETEWIKFPGGTTVQNMISVTLPPNTVKWEKGDYLMITEKIGGSGFPLIESIMFEGNKVPIVTDFNSIYEVTTEWKLQGKKKQFSRIKSVNEFTGVFYVKESEFNSNFRRVEYLEEYINNVINKKLSWENYLKNGLEDYFINMREYKHNVAFLDELKKSRKEKREIDWSVIK